MKKTRTKIKCLIAMTCVASLTLSLLVGCGNKVATTSTPTTTDLNGGAPYEISIMLPTFTGDPMKEDSVVKAELEKYTNTKLKFIFVPSTSYADKLNITLASGDLPTILECDKTPSIINAAKSGAFWEVGPLLKNYTNLSKANPVVLNNTSIDGKSYSLYRTRPYGRNGIALRQDWLDNVGLKQPTTIDEFYNVLKAFTNNDPDKNGKNDTYGMAVSKYIGPFNITLTWFGGPNGWGEDKSGKLQPSFLTAEYLENLKFWKKMYDEKLINSDFPVFDDAKWSDQVVNGKAGVIVDVLDNAAKMQEKMEKADPKTTAKIDILGQVSGPSGMKNLPTSGFSGMFVFPKSSNKTEQVIKRVLAFMDKTNDKDAQVLIVNGKDGRQFKLEDGFAAPIANNPTPLNEWNDLNQLGTSIVPGGLTAKLTPLRVKANTIMEENIKTAVANPAAPIISTTYTTSGPQLDEIIETARVKFIVGKIDEAGFKAALELWKKTGGDNVLKETNDEYAKIKKK